MGQRTDLAYPFYTYSVLKSDRFMFDTEVSKRHFGYLVASYENQLKIRYNQSLI